MKYTANEVLQGIARQEEAKETDQSFTQGNFDQTKPRMAGATGARAVQLMNDPTERALTDRWMGLFGLSNEGAQFEQAKINKAINGLI